jgi:hypothetical protein
MPKTIEITTTYDADTRVLTSVATATGFVPPLPDEVVTATQVDTITLGSDVILTDADYKTIQRSAVMSLNGVNIKLRKFVEAAAALEEATKIIAAEPVDP